MLALVQFQGCGINMTFSKWEAQWPLDFAASLLGRSMGESGFDPRTWQKWGQRRGRLKRSPCQQKDRRLPPANSGCRAAFLP